MSTPTPIQILREAAERGLKLGVKLPDTLTVEPAGLCSPDFAATFRTYKSALLHLLRLPFVMVYSKPLGETIFFCEDESTKAALVEAGAESGSIYTRAELKILVEHNRAKPFLPDELCKLHEIRKTFHGRLAP